MAMKSLASPSFVMFDAVYVDGTRSCESQVAGQRVGRFGSKRRIARSRRPRVVREVTSEP
jgi:hypothetical protein